MKMARSVHRLRIAVVVRQTETAYADRDRLNAAAAAGDGLGNLAGRSADQAGAADKGESGVAVPPTGFVDPTPRISLSADALLYLGRAKRTPEKLPPLTKDEWNNRLSPQLAAREHQAFGRLAETGDYRAYYRAFIDYYDGLRPEDQNSLRYFGTREAAVAGLRSLDYDATAAWTWMPNSRTGQRLSRGRQDCPFAGHNHDVAGRTRLFRLGCVQHQLRGRCARAETDDRNRTALFRAAITIRLRVQQRIYDRKTPPSARLWLAFRQNGAAFNRAVTLMRFNHSTASCVRSG